MALRHLEALEQASSSYYKTMPSGYEKSVLKYAINTLQNKIADLKVRKEQCKVNLAKFLKKD